MALLKSISKSKEHWDTLVEEIKSTTDTNRYSALFIELIAWLRPRRKEHVAEKMSMLLDRLESDRSFADAIRRLFVYLFNTRDSQSLFTSVGVLSSSSFFSELARQFNHRIIPPLPEKRSMNYLFERAFHKRDDYKWVRAIPDEQWITFFKYIAADISDGKTPLQQYLINALTVLSYRVSSLGLETELNQRMQKELDVATPFIEQNKKIQTFIHLVRAGEAMPELVEEAALQIMDQLDECNKIIADIRSHTLQYGTSLGQSYLLTRASQQISRMRIITEFLTGTVPQKTIDSAVRLFKSTIESINKRNSIRDLYKQNSGMLAYQIAEHKSASGEHYITTTRSEYTAFFYSAAAGGVIIAGAALIKALLHKMHIAMFWQYFLYGFNYALFFVILFVTGASLATKQPTMTASALASSLDTRKGSSSLPSLAITFAKVWRSQFASFAGNLIVVFPLSYILAVIWHQLSGTLLLDTPAASLQALHDQNPTKSAAWLYACITGVCLFVSGIITGYVDNKVIYGNIGARIKEHSGLRTFIKPEKLQKIGDYIHNNLGGIIGNISLGFMLGYAKLIGEFFGIPFDIRHITISTAYFAFGVEGLDNQLPAAEWIWTTIGVIGIGFFNFAISFSLAFYVALRSRNVSLSQLPFVGKLIIKYLSRHPKDFVYPPAEDRRVADVFPETVK
jgi:site-specific recombinase